MEIMILCALLISLKDCLSAEIPNVMTRVGKINGETKTVAFQKDTYEVDRYLGIPYAKAPTGDRRFKKPELHEAFSEPYDAVAFGPSCPQHDFLSLRLAEEMKSEDCLFLNVYVPRQEPDERAGYAVLFYIPGGGFTMGSGSVGKGEVLAAVGNVIVVTINYRIGLLGFLDINDPKSPGNFGLWDQQLALQWVHKNIGSFGGDKDRVTIFGESAGSISVAYQMLYPPNKGLFMSGITQGGSPTLTGTFFPENNIDTAKYFAEKLDCTVENTDEIFTCLQKANSDDIIQIVADIQASPNFENSNKVINSPTVDGDFIRISPNDLFKMVKTEPQPEVDFFRSLKLMNGMNGAEGTMFLLLLGNPDNLDEFEITHEQMNLQHIPIMLTMALGFDQTIPEVVQQIVISEYTDWKNPDDPKTLREQLVRLYSDWYFNVPGVELSQLHCNASNVVSYVYNFLALLDKHLLKVPKWIKTANHGDDMGPVFGYNFDFEKLFSAPNYVPPDWELKLSKRMMIYWSNFAKSGNPNKPVPCGDPSVIWPRYNIASQEHIKFNREDSIGQYLHAREIDLWRNILPAVFEATVRAKTISFQSFQSFPYQMKETDACDKDGNCDGN